MHGIEHGIENGNITVIKIKFRCFGLPHYVHLLTRLHSICLAFEAHGIR